jgi:dTMP kinase
MARIDSNHADRIESESMTFHRRVYAGYLKLEKRYPGRIVGIEGDRSIDAIHADIREQVVAELNRKGILR